MQRRRVQRALLIYLAVFVGLGAFSWIWFALHRHGPHYFPLGAREERFGDLIRFTAKFQHGRDPRMVDYEQLLGTLFPRNYPPLDVLLYLFLLQVCAPHAVAVLVGVFYVGVLVFCVGVWRRVNASPTYRTYMGVAVFATGLLGWGGLQVAMRANIEGWMWLALATGAWLFFRERYAGSAVAFGIAMCIKPYPALWLGLLVRQRRWKEAGLGVLTWAGVTVGSLLFIDRNPLKAYARISGKSTFFEDYIVSFRPVEEMMGDHSLLQTMKAVARIIRNHGLQLSHWDYGMHASDPLAWKLYDAYVPLAVLIGVAVLWRVWTMPLLNQVFAIATLTALLPFIAGDYTLTTLLIPMGLLVISLIDRADRGEMDVRLGQLLWILVPCAVIQGTVQRGELHGVVKCLALIVLLVAATVTRLGETPAVRKREQIENAVPVGA